MDILRGKKVYLKLIEEKDLQKRVEWINNSDIQNTLNYDVPTSLAKTKAWFNKILLDNSRREFSIFTVENDEYVGFCGLFNIEMPIMKAELHSVIGNKEYHGGGYGTETYKLLMDYGFKELGLNKIYGYQLVYNYAAHRVVEKLGWKRDGLLRKDVLSHGEIKDRYIVSILKEDWEKLSQGI
jgi:RimJ/RimL family protein N-acetyltransferase